MKGFIHQNTLYFHPTARHRRVRPGRERKRSSLNVPRRFGRVCPDRGCARAPFVRCVIGRTVSSEEGLRVTRKRQKKRPRTLEIIAHSSCRRRTPERISPRSAWRREWRSSEHLAEAETFGKKRRRENDIKSKGRLPISLLTHQASISSHRIGIGLTRSKSLGNAVAHEDKETLFWR